MSYDNNFYPITQVNGASVPGDIPCPTGYTWKLSDVSASDAGRTEDALMHKKLITQKRHLELEWENVYRNEAAAILAAFNTEYFDVTYWDILTNGYRTDTFYSGDRERDCCTTETVSIRDTVQRSANAGTLRVR